MPPTKQVLLQAMLHTNWMLEYVEQTEQRRPDLADFCLSD
jgi:hypothetical protein